MDVLLKQYLMCLMLTNNSPLHNNFPIKHNPLPEYYPVITIRDIHLNQRCCRYEYKIKLVGIFPIIAIVNHLFESINSP